MLASADEIANYVGFKVVRESKATPTPPRKPYPTACIRRSPTAASAPARWPTGPASPMGPSADSSSARVT